MKNLILKTKFVVMSLLIVLFISCNGEDGAMGPAGQNGIDGADGNDGQDGNANVIASNWFDLTWSANPSTFGLYDQTAADITQDILDSDVILIYVENSSGVVYLTPTIWNSSAFVGSRAEVGTIRVYYNSDTSINMSAIQKVRYVIIPSNNTTKTAGFDFTKMSYEEVINYFDLDY